MKTETLTLTQRFLFVLTIIIILIILGSALNVFDQSRQQEHSATLVEHYTQSMVQVASSQLGDFIDANDNDSLETFIQQISRDEAIISASVYSIDGNLLSGGLQEDFSLFEQGIALTNDIYFKEKQVGFLTIFFNDNYLHDFYLLNPEENQQSTFIALLSAGLLIIVVFLGISRRKFTVPLIPIFSGQQEKYKHPSEIFKAIVEQNKTKKELLSQETLIVIKADWQLEKKREQTRILRFFKNWLAHTHWHVSSFSDGLLHIATGNFSQQQMLTKVRMLDVALSQLNIQPTILIHSVDIEATVYHHFFDVITPGIWTEQQVETFNHDTTSQQKTTPTEEPIDLEIDGLGKVTLFKVAQATTQELKFIKKQVARLKK